MSNAGVQICRGFTVEQWSLLRPGLDAGDDAAWRIAVEVFERRIKERFLTTIESLIAADSGASADVEVPTGAPADGSTLPSASAVVPGFAIVALTSILIETLQSFCVSASLATQQQFVSFLQRGSFGGAFSKPEVAASFSKGVRNGVLHEGETRGWVLWRAEPVGSLVEELGGGRYALNRTAFYRAVECEFGIYCASLRSGDPESRKRFRVQIEDMLQKF